MIRRKTIASDKTVCAASDIRRTMPDATLMRLIMPTKDYPLKQPRTSLRYSGLNCGFASIKPPSTINDCPVV
nr:hypothetical protein Ef18B006LT_27370 [Escherichia fergusonii]